MSEVTHWSGCKYELHNVAIVQTPSLPLTDCEGTVPCLWLCFPPYEMRAMDGVACSRGQVWSLVPHNQCLRWIRKFWQLTPVFIKADWWSDHQRTCTVPRNWRDSAFNSDFSLFFTNEGPKWLSCPALLSCMCGTQTGITFIDCLPQEQHDTMCFQAFF